MEAYINPAESVKVVGRRLNGKNNDYDAFIGQLRDGEQLYGLYDRLVFKVAHNVMDKDEFDSFYKSYYSGAFVSVEYYAVKP